jgi:hypothetical protein
MLNYFGRLRNIQDQLNLLINDFQQQFAITGGNVSTRRYSRGSRARGSRTNVNQGNVTQIPSGQTRQRHLTAAARRKMSEAAKARWANKTHKKVA